MEPLTVIGHMAIDRIITRDNERQQLGGPPAYTSAVTHLFGTPLYAITKVGGDFPEEYRFELLKRGLNLNGQIIPSAETTRFILDYTGKKRKLSVEAVCEDIKMTDIPDNPKSVLFTPIIGEIEREVYNNIDSMHIALDPQGLLRRVKSDGSIILEPWIDRAFLSKISILKASERELALLSGKIGGAGLEVLTKLGVSIVIMTQGSRGALIQTGSVKMRIPAYESNVVDETGAGDAFLAGFFLEFIKGSDLAWCASIGAVAASGIVETFGPYIKISHAEFMERAEEILDKVEKLN